MQGLKFDVKILRTLEEGKVSDDHKTMVANTWFPDDMWSSDVETLKAECNLMNLIGAEANKRGIKFGYHNHSFEFAIVPVPV